MASIEQEENSGRRTRSGRKVAAPPQPAPRSTRRSSKKHAQEQIAEHIAPQIIDEQNIIDYNHSEENEMKTMFVDSVQVGLMNNDNEIIETHTENIESGDVIEEFAQEDVCIVYEDQIGLQEEQPLEDDVEIYATQTELPVTSETGLDEKSSSFPFGAIEQSETSDEVPNEEAMEAINQTSGVENSLLASLAGDNANSLPSVGGGEETENKILDQLQENCYKMDSEDSISQPAIAEDIAGGNASDATIVNAEMVSEDELPLPEKPEINDAEEVSDEELPAPQRAELPADAEVISEDELPAAGDKKSTGSPGSSKGTSQKRRAEETISDTSNAENTKTITAKSKMDEQYNPMSPTSESNDAPPIEKKAKLEDDADKEKKKEKEKEKEKEKKKLPELDKYWRAVKDDPADFTGWTYLLQYVDNESDAEAAREAYDAFLSHYPYCYGYWRKYADYEKRKGIKANCNAVFERGLEAIPLSVDLWIHYLTHVKNTQAENEEFIRKEFDRAINACGLEFRSDKLWDAYIKWETEAKRYQRVIHIYDRLLSIPTQGYNSHFDNFQDIINQHPITSTLSTEELKKLRIELHESNRLSRSKSHRGSSKDKDSHETSSKSPNRKDGDLFDEELPLASATAEQSVDQEKIQNEAADFSTLTEEEIAVIKDKVISTRRKLHKNTVAAVTARWTFEEGIKRPYFHVKPLERCQLKNWKDYLDFEIENGDQRRILVLFERCLIACALYDEFWLKMVRYLETQLEKPGIVAITSDVYRRACEIHHPDKPSLHLMWAAFEECQGNFDRAAEVLVNFENRCPNILQVAYRRINVERRRGDLKKCRELYEHYISTAKNKGIAGSLAIKYARFLNKICNDLDGGLRVLRDASEKDPANARVILQMIDLALQRSNVDEEEVVLIMDKFMARENIDPEQKVLFAQRKVEFLEDFGSIAKGLQDAQRALQLALSKANEAKKKREKSNTASNTKDSGNPPTPASAQQPAYNNNSTAANANYNYNSNNSSYYGQQNAGAYQQQSYDGYYNHWQYGSGYNNYSQWSGYGNYY